MGKTQQIIERRVDELRQNMFVIHQLVIRDKKRSLSSTFMGELWEVINPLINMVVMVLVFGKMIGNNTINRFPLFVLTGTVIYELFTSGTTMCLDCLIENKGFLLKTKIGKNVYVLEKILLAYRNFLFSLLIYFFVIALYRISPSVTWLFVIIDILLLFILMLGIGKILAIINVTLADVTYFYKIFTLMLMYGSAIFYQVDRLSPLMQKCMLANPLYIAITIARSCIMNNLVPDISLWLILGGYASSVYVIGTIFLNSRIEDIIAEM